MTIKNSIALQFPDMRMLWKFAQILTCKSIEINTSTRTLICDCLEAEIHLAITTYSAKIMEGSLSKVTS